MRKLVLAFILISSSAFARYVNIATASLPNGTVGQPYVGTVVAQDGCLPYKWNAPTGTLPTGTSQTIATDTKSVNISGTPNTAGSYTFTIAVIGCGKHLSSQTYTVSIAAVPPPPVQHKVTLNWNASPTTGVTYNVYRSLITGGFYGLIGTSPGTSFADATVVSGKTYYYVTKASDGVQESIPSNEVAAVIPNP